MLKKKKKIVIFGSGGQAKVIIDIISNLKDFQIHSIYDESKKKIKSISLNKKKYKVNNELKSLLNNKNLYGVIAIGDNYRRYLMYKKIFEVNSNFKFTNIISSQTKISKNIKIGNGNVIMPNVTINAGTEIQDHCIINTSSSIDHDNKFSSFSSVGPGVITGGNVKISRYSHIGIGCVILNNISIGANTVVGAKSLVNKNVIKNIITYGCPARKIRSRKLGKKYL